MTLPALVVGYGFTRLSEATQQVVLEWLMAADVRAIAAGIAALVLAPADAILLALAARRFKRARLVFD